MLARAGPGLLALGGAMLVATACSGSNAGTATAAQEALQNQVCTQADLGPDYREETAGDFSAGNLADLSTDAPTRRSALDAAGLKRGYFAYWKENVNDPPFNPPNEVVCQVLEFGADAEATAFVAAMQPTPEELVTTAIAWIPASSRSVSEEAVGGIGLPHSRAFRLSASDKDIDVSLFAVVVPDGRYVRSAYTGGQDSKATVADAVAIEDKISARAP
jgi:hypothetical protein